jgi:serine/threonine protein kinase
LCIISDYVVDLSRFEEANEIGVGGTGSAQLYRQCGDGLEIFVKLFGEFDPDECCMIEREIEKLMNVRRPCIAAAFGLIFPIASKKLKTVRSYARSGSLKDVLLARPLWWAPTAKVIAIAGIVLKMKFLHRFGLIYGGLKPGNALFDEHNRIQIADFG